MSYQLQVANTGNVKSDSTILIDTISANGIFYHASITPSSVSANKQIVVWNLGTLSATTGVKNISLTVQTLPDLGPSQLKNDVNVHSSSVSTVSAAEIVTPIVPVRPASMSLSETQKYVWGTANRDSSGIIAVISDSLGAAIPDGVPVTFSTNLGFFDNGTKNYHHAHKRRHSGSLSGFRKRQQRHKNRCDHRRCRGCPIRDNHRIHVVNNVPGSCDGCCACLC